MITGQLTMIYGTAWKKAETTDLVIMAVLKGFRGIDTACQPKHYREDLVGEALQILSAKHSIHRSSLFLQTKFTSIDGQDSNIPYNPKSPISTQVEQSFKKSLINLKTDFIDSLVLHGPMQTFDQTMEVWRVFESFVEKGVVRQIGISNCYDFKYFVNLFDEATVKPKVLQNRFYPGSQHDVELRSFCTANDIQYQSFWSLTGNPKVLKSSIISSIAKRLENLNGKNVSNEQVFYRFLIKIGICPLNGTTDGRHMEEDLAVLNWDKSSIDLTAEEVESIQNILFKKNN